MLINSRTNEKVKTWKKIRTKKYIDELGLFIVEGEHLTEEAIKSKTATSLIILEGTDYEATLPKYFVTEKVMASISLMKTPPKVMAVVKKNDKPKDFGNKIIFLDDVSDPGNLGTIIRTSVAFNFDTIIISSGSASIYNDKVIRASQGMIFKTNIITGEKSELLKELKQKGYTIYGTKMDGNLTPEETKNEKIVFILGNEGKGISSESLYYCDNTVRLPMNENCESLNVAITSAIIMYIKR